MNPLAPSVRYLVMDTAMTALFLQFFGLHNQWPELQEFPDFVDTIGANQSAILSIIDGKFPAQPSMSSQIARYPGFWELLAHNVQLEAIPRNRRPGRAY